jgi:hypothetical protein
MERFYFHQRQGDQLLPDDEGVDYRILLQASPKL